MEIKDLRDEIDEIDAKIISLLEKRFLVIDVIKRFKKNNNLKTFDANREQEILKKVKSSNQVFDKYLKSIYLEVLKQSKEYQND